MQSSSDYAAIGPRIEAFLGVLCGDIDTLFDKLAEQDRLTRPISLRNSVQSLRRDQVFKQLDISLTPEENHTNVFASLH